MKVWVFLILLILKHFVVTNVIDVGYSDARRRASRHYRSALMRHVIAEGILTIAVLWTATCYSLLLALAVEAILHVVLCVVERRASMAHILRIHLLCEGALLLAYACLAAISA